MHITRPIWTCKVTQPKSVTGWPHRANVPDLSFGLQISFSIKACSLVQVVDHKRLLLGGIFCSGLAAGIVHSLPVHCLALGAEHTSTDVHGNKKGW